MSLCLHQIWFDEFESTLAKYAPESLLDLQLFPFTSSLFLSIKSFKLLSNDGKECIWRLGYLSAAVEFREELHYIFHCCYTDIVLKIIAASLIFMSQDSISMRVVPSSLLW